MPDRPFFLNLVNVSTVSVAIALAILVGCGDSNDSNGGATLTVNDQDFLGTVGDHTLSLSEAIRLANGSLALGELGREERAQVKGRPGSGTADLITFDVPPGTKISAQAAVDAIIGNTNDTIDGGGVTLSGSGTGNGMTISSSGFTVKNLTIEGFLTGVVIDPAGQSLEDITLTNLQIGPAPGGGLLVGSSVSNGSLKGLTITDNLFVGDAISLADGIKALRDNSPSLAEGEVELLRIGIGAALARGTSVVSNTLLEDVLFARNTVINGVEGLYVFGGLVNGTEGGAEVHNSIVRHVQLIDNKFTGVVDASLNAIGAEGRGTGSNNGVEDLTISGNYVEAYDWGIALWGGEQFGYGSSQGNYVAHATIRDNTVVGIVAPTFGAGGCIDLEGAWTTIAPGVISGSFISNVLIENNHVSGNCSVGIKATGGVALAAVDAITTGNSVYNVTIRGNDVKDATIGLELQGGFSLLPGAGALASDNTLSSFNITGNTFIGSGSGTGIHLVGGTANGSSVTANSVHDITFGDNVIQGYTEECVTVVDVGPNTSGNLNDVACP
jgi:hypothetical protein